MSNVALGRPGCFIGFPCIRGNGKISIGDSFILASNKLSNPIGLFRPCIIEAICSESIVSIGDGFSASGCCIVAERQVFIGNNVGLGANVTIIDTDFHSTDAGLREMGNSGESMPVRVGNGVWIGMNAVILKGVDIGDDAVIGACAVVSKSVPPGAVVVGNPARVVRMKSGN